MEGFGKHATITKIEVRCLEITSSLVLGKQDSDSLVITWR